MRTSPGPSITLSADDLGPPGIRGELKVLARFPSDSRRDRDRLHDNSLRRFSIAARLSNTPPAAHDIRGDFTEADGSSYLLAPVGADHFALQGEFGEMRLSVNAKREVSYVEAACEARSCTEARHIFLRAVLPFLDRMVYETRSPLFVETVRVEDQANQVTTVGFTGPFRKSTVLTHRSEVPRECIPIYAMYREAKNASSDFYRFLCYYKLLEGLLGALRARVNQQAKAEDKRLPHARLVVPESPNYPPRFRRHAGKPIKPFFDNVLTPQFRNAVAHLVTDENAMLNIADPEHVDLYAETVFITEQCARVVIANHEACLAALAL